MFALSLFHKMIHARFGWRAAYRTRYWARFSRDGDRFKGTSDINKGWK
jgi:hypothetical protein